MKMRSIYLSVAVMLVAFSIVTAWPQSMLVRVSGRVTSGKEPVADLQVVFTNLDTKKVYKAPVAKNGEYVISGVERATYQVEVVNDKGEVFYRQRGEVTSVGNGFQTVDIDIAQGSKPGKPTKEQEAQMEAIKAQNAKAESVNALISQAQTAMAAKNDQAAIPVLTQLTQMDPNRWQFFSALAQSHANLGQYDEAVQNYDKGIQVAQNIVAGNVKDSKNPDADPAKAKTGLSQMLSQEGNVYLKMKKNPEAIAAFEKAATLDPNPGAAYFNICATQYNSGNTNGAVEACNKAIAADPTRADAYFIKGSLMVGQGSQGKDGKYVVPDGTAEALNKYLELAPTGQHANDVKEMLAMIGAKIETNYKATKKK